MCIRDSYRTGWIRMLAKLKENVDKCCRGNQQLSNKAVSYTHLDVYKRQAYAGYSQVPHATSEFDVTDLLNEGKNTLAVLVLKWCDGSYSVSYTHLDVYKRQSVFSDFSGEDFDGNKVDDSLFSGDVYKRQK